MDVPQTLAPPRRPATANPSHRARARPRPRPEGCSATRIELIQRGRMLVDLAAALLIANEARLGPFHDDTWRDRRTLDDVQRAWDRLRAQFGTPTLDWALNQPPVRPLLLNGDPRARFLVIAGKTYRADRLPGNDLAPRLVRLHRLPDHDDGPYHACRLRDGATQCDCGEWFYHVLDTPDAPPCKHLATLRALGWI